MPNFDKTKPAGTQKLRLSDDEIRANWDALEDAISRNHKFPQNYGQDAGEHTVIDLINQTEDPSTPSGKLKLYAKTISGNIKLCIKNPNAQVIDLQDHGQLSGLGDDDHPQYLHLNKTGQTLQQNLAVADGVTIDGIDISVAISDLNNRINGMWPPPIFHARDQKTSGTEGGSSISGIQTRVLNTVVTNTISGASLSNNQITLPAGKYKVWARCPGYRVGEHQAGLYNVTDSSYTLLGSNAYVSNTYTGHSDSIIIGYLSISSQKVFELRHYTANAISNNGLGKAANSGMGSEIYSEIFIRKIGD